jgi:hypothetical protein
METDMTGRIRGRTTKFASAILVAIGASAVTAAAASAVVVYNNIPNPLPGNGYTVGAQAEEVNEFGGQVGAAGTARNKSTVEVVMSSKACQLGSQAADSCATPKPSKTFKWPVTLNIYEVGPGNSVGLQIASITTNVKMPYRPGRDPVHCPDPAANVEGGWYDATADIHGLHCFHGMAFVVKFKTKLKPIPTNTIMSVAYNSENFGPIPVGTKPCDSTSAGCPYNYLSSVITETSEAWLSVGANPTGDVYVNTAAPEWFAGPECQGAPIGVSGVFSPNNCLGTMHMQPEMKVEASS